jgi:hypothetical protein
MGWGVVQTAATAGNGGPEAVPYQVLYLAKYKKLTFCTPYLCQQARI